MDEIKRKGEGEVEEEEDCLRSPSDEMNRHCTALFPKGQCNEELVTLHEDAHGIMHCDTSFVGKLQSGVVSLQQKGNTNAKRTILVRGDLITVSSGS